MISSVPGLGACPVDHGLGSRSLILIEATSTVSPKMYWRLSQRVATARNFLSLLM